MHATIKHTTLTGHVIEFEQSSAASLAFLAKLEAMVDDESVSETEMIGLAYGQANPFLNHELLPGRGAVTLEVFNRPEYAIMGDLLFRKGVAVRHNDVAKLAAEYTLTVSEAAKRLGVHESSIRQAIHARRLSSWVKEGCYYLAPRSVDAFVVGTRGPKPATRTRPESQPAPSAALAVVVGHVDGLSLKVKPGDIEDKQRLEGNVVSGRISTWTRAAVLIGTAKGLRMFVIEPAGDEETIAVGPFSVRGRFRITKKINAEKAARAAWEVFSA